MPESTDALQMLTPTAWVPIVVIRASGKPCICYHPWATDEGCECDLPTGTNGDPGTSS